MTKQQNGRPYRRIPSEYMVDPREKDIVKRRWEGLIKQGRGTEAEPWGKKLDQIAESEEWIRNYSL